MKTLIICPLNLIEDAWRLDSIRFEGFDEVLNLWDDTKKKRSRLIASDWEIGAINYESWKNHKEEFEGIGIRRVLLDESSKLKGHGTDITKKIFSFVWLQNLTEFYQFSGMPAPTKREQYYMQIRCVDKDAFPRTFWAFRNRYFYQYGSQPWMWKIRSEMEEEFVEILNEHAMFVEKDDCFDMPQILPPQKRTFPMESKQARFYKELDEEWLIENEGVFTIAQSAIVERMKLRQITSGYTVGEDGNWAPLFPTVSQNPRIKALKALIEEIGHEQIIIACTFKRDIQDVVDALGFDNCSQMHGSIKTKERSGQVACFRSGETDYMVCHPASLGHGFTLSNCSYIIWYSLVWDVELHYQLGQRTFSPDPERTLTTYYLQARDSVDEEVFESLVEGTEMSQILLRRLKK